MRQNRSSAIQPTLHNFKPPNLNSLFTELEPVPVLPTMSSSMFHVPLPSTTSEYRPPPKQNKPGPSFNSVAEVLKQDKVNGPAPPSSVIEAGKSLSLTFSSSPPLPKNYVKVDAPNPFASKPKKEAIVEQEEEEDEKFERKYDEPSETKGKTAHSKEEKKKEAAPPPIKKPTKTASKSKKNAEAEDGDCTLPPASNVSDFMTDSVAKFNPLQGLMYLKDVAPFLLDRAMNGLTEVEALSILNEEQTKVITDLNKKRKEYETEITTLKSQLEKAIDSIAATKLEMADGPSSKKQKVEEPKLPNGLTATELIQFNKEVNSDFENNPKFEEKKVTDRVQLCKKLFGLFCMSPKDRKINLLVEHPDNILECRLLLGKILECKTQLDDLAPYGPILQKHFERVHINDPNRSVNFFMSNYCPFGQPRSLDRPKRICNLCYFLPLNEKEQDSAKTEIEDYLSSIETNVTEMEETVEEVY